MKSRRKPLAIAMLIALLFAAAAPAQADEPPAYGPGMMGGGYGPGMMRGYGPGPGGYGPPSGYGPGAGYGPGPGYGGYGPGMMGGYGYGMMGPGMMGGWGYGPGMMGGGGYGAGMMGWGGPLYLLNLSEEQRAKVDQIRDESRRKNWEVMGRMLDEQARLRELLLADKRDANAIGKQSMKIAELRRQMLEASVEASNRIEALLTKEQKAQLRTFRRGWMMGDGD